LPYPPTQQCEFIMLSTLREGDISTLSNRGHFYFALTAILLACMLTGLLYQGFRFLKKYKLIL
jgi:hypothetical protein